MVPCTSMFLDMSFNLVLSIRIEIAGAAFIHPQSQMLIFQMPYQRPLAAEHLRTFVTGPWTSYLNFLVGCLTARSQREQIFKMLLGMLAHAVYTSWPFTASVQDARKWPRLIVLNPPELRSEVHSPELERFSFLMNLLFLIRTNRLGHLGLTMKDGICGRTVLIHPTPYSIHPSIHLSIHLSIHPSIHPGCRGW